MHSKTVIDQFLDPFAACLTREVAQRIVELQLDPLIQSRIDVLADKANDGCLTPSERTEYTEFVDGFDLLALLKAKARQVLAVSGK